MLHHEREIFDTDLLCAILDMIDTVHVGIHDEVYPYVVPLSFGYRMDEDNLIIYLHCARKGYKLMLMEKNPHLCCTFSAFSNFPKKIYKGHRHDFRSVMAFGVARKVSPQSEPLEFAQGIRALLQHYDRIPAPGEQRGFPNFNIHQLPHLYLIRVECPRSQVFGKSEFPVRTLEDVPFKDVYNLPDDDTEYDIADLEQRPKRFSPYDIYEKGGS